MKRKQYSEQLKKQYLFADSGAIHAYLDYLYSHLVENVETSAKVLEVGAGAGTSTLFLNHKQILRTDLLETESTGVMGGVDILRLPFGEGQYDFTFGMDVLHHLTEPYASLKELCRVTKIDKKREVIVLIEPYVSAFSFFIYRIFHSESTSLYLKRSFQLPKVSENPEDGDQTIPRMIFLASRGKKRLHEIFPESDFRIDIKLVSFLSFFMTGGINRPLPTPKALVKLMIKLEEKIPQMAMRFLASRMIITIIKV